MKPTRYTVDLENCKKLKPQSIKVLNWLLRLLENNQLPDKKGHIDRKIAELMVTSDDAIRKQFQIICNELKIPSEINGINVNKRDLLHEILQEDSELQGFLKKADLTRATRKPREIQESENTNNHTSAILDTDQVDTNVQRFLRNDRSISKLDTSSTVSRTLKHSSTESHSPQSLDLSNLEIFCNNLRERQEIILESKEFELLGELKLKKAFLKSWWQVDQGNKKVISCLNDLIDNGDEFTRIEAASILCEIDPGNEQALNILIESIETVDDDEKICRFAVKKLGEVGLSKPIIISALIVLSKNCHQQKTQVAIFETLGKIGKGYPTVIDFFEKTYEDWFKTDNLNNNHVNFADNQFIVNNYNNYSDKSQNENNPDIKWEILENLTTKTIDIKHEHYIFKLILENENSEEQERKRNLTINLENSEKYPGFPSKLNIVLLDELEKELQKINPQEILNLDIERGYHFIVRVLLEQKIVYQGFFVIK